MAVTFSPAPWEWRYEQLVSAPLHDEYERLREIAEADVHAAYPEYPQAIVETESGHYGPNGADGALIEAAPDLLAACKLALGAFERNDAINWDELAAAIAKAERGIRKEVTACKEVTA